MSETLNIVKGRVAIDFLRSKNRFKEVHRKLTDLLSRKFGQGDVNISLAPKNVGKAKVLSMKKFSSGQAMLPYIEYLDNLGVKCGIKDPNNRCFDISLLVTFEFILNHMGEEEYKEAIRISKGRPGNEDLGIEPVEGGAKFAHSSNGTSPNGNGQKGQLVTNVRPENPGDNPITEAPKQEVVVNVKRWDKETLKPALKALLKKYKLKSKGFPGKSPEGSIGCAVVSVKNQTLAEKLFTELGFHYSCKPSKSDQKIIIFRFYPKSVQGVTRVYVENSTDAAISQYLADNSGENENPKKVLPTAVVPPQNPMEVRLLVRKLVKKNDLGAANCFPGRMSGDVITHVMISNKSVELASEIFGKAGLVFKHKPSKTYKQATLFQFYETQVVMPEAVETPLGKPTPEVGIPKAEEKPEAQKVEHVAPTNGQAHKLDEASISESLARMATALEKGLVRHSASAVADRMVRAIEAQGIWLLTGQAQGKAPMQFKELTSNDLRELFTSILDQILPR